MALLIGAWLLPCIGKAEPVLIKVVQDGKLSHNEGTFQYHFEQLKRQDSATLIWGNVDPREKLKEMEEGNGIPLTKGESFVMEIRVHRFAVVENKLSVLSKQTEFTGGQPFGMEKVEVLDLQTSRRMTLEEALGEEKAAALTKRVEQDWNRKRTAPECQACQRYSKKYAGFFLHETDGVRKVDFYFFAQGSSFPPVVLTYFL